MESCHSDCLLLTKGQQDVLAELCHLSRSILYSLNNPKEQVLMTDVGDKFCDILEKAQSLGFTPQSFDRLYDLLHRTGANA